MERPGPIRYPRRCERRRLAIGAPPQGFASNDRFLMDRTDLANQVKFT